MIKRIPHIYNFLNENEERELKTKLSDEVGRKLVKVFRAVANNQDYFKDKDYVTLSRRFAVEHAENNHVYNDEQQKVIMAFIWTTELFNALNPGEYFYHGKDLKGKNNI